MKHNALSSRRAQSVLEYTMLVGIITIVLFYIGTGIKRGMQSLVKVTADQVGNQQNSDQDFNDVLTGYMGSSVANIQESNNRQVVEVGYIVADGNAVYIANTTFNNYTDTTTNSITNAGFQPVPPGQ